jgi:hypothetical protein
MTLSLMCRLFLYNLCMCYFSSVFMCFPFLCVFTMSMVSAMGPYLCPVFVCGLSILSCHYCSLLVMCVLCVWCGILSVWPMYFSGQSRHFSW